MKPAAPKGEELVERVLNVVDAIPRGEVLAYGEIGELVGCGPRAVGRIMRLHASTTNWWRVVRADGSSAVAEQALPHWRADGLPVRGERVDLQQL